MARRRRLRLSTVSRAGGNVVDQALSALSNMALSIVVARSFDAEGFGAFAVAFTVFGIGVAATKSVVGQVFQIQHGASSPAEIREAARGALGAAVLVGLLATVCCGAAAVVTHGPLRAALVALAVIFPVLLAQDSCRMVCFAAGRSWFAAAFDGIWSVVTFALLGALVLSGHSDLSLMMFAWGGGALVSLVVALKGAGAVPRLRSGVEWLRRHRDLTRYLAGEYVLGLGATQLAILLVGVVASTSAVGSLRAAQVLLGPLAIVGVGAFQFVVPEVARRQHLGTRGRRAFGLGVSGVLGVITISYVVLLLLLPDELGAQIFGESWTGASRVLLAVGISSLFSSLANGPAGVLYGLGRAPNTFRINLAKGPVLLVSVLVATGFGGAVGAAWALAATEAVVLPAWVWTFWKQTAVVRSSGAPNGPNDSSTSDASTIPDARRMS